MSSFEVETLADIQLPIAKREATPNHDMIEYSSTFMSDIYIVGSPVTTFNNVIINGTE
jgi:hypothetical protein